MDSRAKLLVALGAGIAAGIVLGVLIAPEKGSVTRQKIADEGKKLLEKFKQSIQSESEKTNELADDVCHEVIGST